MLGLAVLFCATAGYTIHITRQLDDNRDALREAVRAREAAEKALIVMADEHASAIERKTVATEGKERVRVSSKGNHPPISEPLRNGLETTDLIGGVE